MDIQFYFNIFKELIKSEFVVFRQVLFNKFIDLSIWVILTIVVTGHIMPYFGLKADFGLFQFGGVLAAVGLFELYYNIIEFIQDLEGERIINYYLTLPMPSWLAIISKTAYYFLTYSILSLFILPVGKLVLWNQLDLSQISYFKLILALILQNIFYACFVTWIVGVVKNMSNIGIIWARFIFPMWFMGGFQFSWIALYSASPVLSYINLLNPMIYITESTRVALIGQAGYINFWLCLLAIAVFSGITLIFGISKLKKRLDFI